MKNSAVALAIERRVYWVFEGLPRKLRRRIVGAVMPNYVLAASCAITGPDGRVLVARSSYRRSWVFPGGLLNRNETPDDAVRREVKEEVGLDIKLSGNPIVMIDPETRRMDFLYAGTAETTDVVLNPAEMDDYLWLDPADIEEFAATHPSMIRRKLQLLAGDATTVVVSWEEIDGRQGR